MGFIIYTRDFRARENILQEREMIYARLSENLPAFSQHDVNQSKKSYVLVKEYPGYIFIWIIMGSHGNTHKEMAQEVGPSINLRGRGSHKLSKKLEPSYNDELHVLVEEDNNNSLEKDYGMV